MLLFLPLIYIYDLHDRLVMVCLLFWPILQSERLHKYMIYLDCNSPVVTVIFSVATASPKSVANKDLDVYNFHRHWKDL